MQHQHKFCTLVAASNFAPASMMFSTFVWVYVFMVVEMSACPSIAWIVFGLTPALFSVVAYVWRKI